MKKYGSVLILISIILSAIPALAEVWDSPHYYRNKRDGKIVIYIPGIAEVIRIKESTKNYVPDQCGFISLASGGQSEKVISIKIGGKELINNAVSVSNKPECRMQRDGSYKSSWNNGGVIAAETTLKTSVSYHVYTGSETELTIEQEKKLTNLKTNACGYRMVRGSGFAGVQIDEYKIDGMLYDGTNIPEVKYRRVCWGEGADKVKYTPNIY